MIAGRKLLLADDSVAIQKVIDLTFTDEGMEVTTVGDGQHAWERLAQLAPDVVLADVFMPGIDGYDLCELIKQHERFAGIPVILLVGSFEPFDEAKARRVGADDVVTKPFQSIRQLVSRVGSLVGSDDGEPKQMRQYSTLGLDSKAEQAEESHNESNVTVLIEAPTMTELAPEEISGESCSTDIEMQTADTQKLPPVDGELLNRNALSSEIHTMGGPEMRNLPNQQTTQPQAADVLNDSFLDLDNAPLRPADDFILDLESDAWSGNESPSFQIDSPEPAEFAEAFEAKPSDEPELHAVEAEDWKIVPAAIVEEPRPAASIAEAGYATETNETGLSNLSPETVDVIARRAVEQMSDRVVREIAWEVVPDLAELLIRKKLDEQK